jgi:hypothetical protein
VTKLVHLCSDVRTGSVAPRPRLVLGNFDCPCPPTGNRQRGGVRARGVISQAKKQQHTRRTHRIKCWSSCKRHICRLEQQ